MEGFIEHHILVFIILISIQFLRSDKLSIYDISVLFAWEILLVVMTLKKMGLKVDFNG